MIKKLLLLITTVCLAFNVSCKKNSKYDGKISQLRNDVFTYDCTDFCLTVYSEFVETPLLNDGVKGKVENVLTFKLKNKNASNNFENCHLSFNLNKKDYSKNFEFKQIPSLLICTVVVEELPSSKFDVMLTINGKSQAIALNSVKNKSTKSYVEVLKSLEKEEEFSNKINENVELRIRLINNDGYDYWFVGIIDEKTTTSYLIDGETLEIVAKK